MTASIPPDRRRLAAARAAGLRPRSRLWVLGAVAGGLALALGPVWSGARIWLDSRLAAAMAGSGLGWSGALGPSLGLVVLVGVLAGAGASVVLRRPPAGHEPRLDAGLDEISGLARSVTCVAALAVVAWTVRGAPAAAARSVDVAVEAGQVAALATVWRGWAARTLTALALACLALGVIERLASARRLWQGLHLTPTEARERARASARRRP